MEQETQGLNKGLSFVHIYALATGWAIMMAWIAVPPAAVMAIIEWVTNIVFDMALPISTITIIGLILLLLMMPKWKAGLKVKWQTPDGEMEF